MCFSATASFTASAVLAGAGAASIKNSSKKARLFAFTPFLFSIQQFIEGLQWLAIHRNGPSLWLGYGFIFFAFLLWPTYMPLTYLMMERDKDRRRKIKVWAVIGAVVSVLLLIALIRFPLDISEQHNHIRYFVGIAQPAQLSIVYTLAICVAGLWSSYFYVRLLAGLVFISSAISGWLLTSEYVSTWCFFAALLSVVVVLGVVEERKANREQR